MNRSNAFFEDAVFENDDMWYFDNFIQAVCRMDLKTSKVDIVSCYTGGKMFHIRWIFLFCDKLYMAESNSVRLLVYDRKHPGSEGFHIIEPDCGHISEQFTVYFYQDSIWFIPRYTDEELYIFDLALQKYKQQDLFMEMSIKCFGINKYPIVFSSFCNGILWFAAGSRNQYVRFDFFTGTYEEFRLSDESLSPEGICAAGGRVWLTLKNSSDIVCMEHMPEHIHIEGRQSYSWLYNAEKFLVVLPRYSSNVILIDKYNNHDIHIVTLPFDEKEKERKSGCSNIVNCHEHSGFIYLFPHGVRGFFRMNESECKAERIESDCGQYENARQELLKRQFDNNHECSENQELDFRCFLDYLKNKDFSGKEEKEAEEDKTSIGKKIWIHLNN